MGPITSATCPLASFRWPTLIECQIIKCTTIILFRSSWSLIGRFSASNICERFAEAFNWMYDVRRRPVIRLGEEERCQDHRLLTQPF
jgi:hypothetical protein